MNIFQKIVARESDAETRLGNPLNDDPAARERRMNHMMAMSGGKGFREEPRGQKLSKGGKTRKELIKEGVFRPLLLNVRK